MIIHRLRIAEFFCLTVVVLLLLDCIKLYLLCQRYQIFVSNSVICDRRGLSLFLMFVLILCVEFELS